MYQYGCFSEVQPERDVSNPNFSNGVIDFRFEVPRNARWSPALSYFRCRLKFTDGNGFTLGLQNDVAPNMYIMDNLFQQMNMSINGIVITEIGDYVAQVGALRSRTHETDTRRQQLGNFMNFSSSEIQIRQNDVCFDGKDLHHNTKLVFKPGAPDATMQYTNADSRLTIVNILGNTLFQLPNLAGVVRKGDIIRFTDDGREYKVVDLFSNLIAFASTTGEIADVPATPNWVVVRDRDSLRAREIEIMWKPPLGVFHQSGDLCGKIKLQMYPQPSSIIQQYAVESLQTKTSGVGNDFNFEVTSMLMYNYIKHYDEPLTGDVGITCEEIRCQSQSLTTASLTNKTFVVNPRVKALTLAFQDEKCESSDTVFSRSKFIITSREDLGLERFYIKFNGRQLPQPIPQIDHNFASQSGDGVPNQKTAIELSSQNYYEGLIYSGMYGKDNMEDFQTWQERGPYYHLRGFGMEGGTRAYISTQFKTLAGTPQVLLFDHWDRVSVLRVVNGVVLDVSSSTYD